MATYTVKQGDNLSTIAKKYGTTWQKIYNANKSTIGSNANLIYAGTKLTIPGTSNTTTNKSTASSSSSDSIQTLANKYAQEKTSNVGSETSELLKMYEQMAENQKNALNLNREKVLSDIDYQKQEANDSYSDNARQAYINKMLGQKTVAQKLSQAGLNTTGVVGKAYSDLESSYGNNLATLQATRDKSINDLNQQINTTNIDYDAQEQSLLADIQEKKLELQKYGNELAYSRYQDAINNYMTFKNYENTLEQQKIAQEQWQKEYELSLKKLASSGNSSSSGSSYYISDTTGNNSSVTGTTATTTKNNSSNNKTTKKSTTNLYSTSKTLPTLSNYLSMNSSVNEFAKANNMTYAEAMAYMLKNK